MRRAVRYLFLTLLLAALPLRGYAGVQYEWCDSHPAHAGATESDAHEQGHSGAHDSGDEHRSGGMPHGAPVCSICAFSCAAAGLAPESGSTIAMKSPVAGRIPYHARQVSVFVPEQPDRPPLPL